MQDQIKKEQQYNHPIAKVWAAITDQEKITQWFMKCDFKAEPGYKYRLLSDDENGTCERVYGTVLTVNPMHELVYSWEVSSVETVTTVTWTLEEKNGGTLLTLVHSGISAFPTEDTAVKMLESFSSGWDACIDHLGQFLAGTNVEAAHR